MRLLLADDHVMFREGLRAFLERHGFDVAAEAVDGREAVCLTRKVNPDVAILDLSMPRLNGIDAAREINADESKTRTIVLTMHDQEDFIVEALRAGVRGYVLKAQATNDLLECLRETSRGATYLSPGLPRVVVEAYFRGNDMPSDSLSSRERLVIGWIAQGKTTDDMARMLGLSPKTVEADRSRIKQKLDIHETAGLVRYAVRHQLAEP